MNALNQTIMKKETLFTRIIGSMMTAVLAMLGFTSCEKEELMYGTPHGDFEISGMVTDEAGTPVDGVRVISRTIDVDEDSPDVENGYLTTYGCDTTYTDSKGRYELDGQNTWLHEAMVVVQDPKGVYESTYEVVKLEYSGDRHDWYMGEAKATANFRLKRSDDKDAE